MNLVYIVEDDENIRELIAYALNNNGFKAQGYSSADSMYEALSEVLPDIFLLDIMLEGDDGYTILRKLKSNELTKEIPVIMLTAKSSEIDKVKGLDMGADDYMTKPFGVMELISRIKAVLRRHDKAPSKKNESMVNFKNITMDLKKRLVYVDNERVKLTYKEYELLYFMIMNKEVVLSRNKLMNEIWGYDYLGESRTVDAHIRTLRQKLGDASKYIKTVRNVGYKISGEL